MSSDPSQRRHHSRLSIAPLASISPASPHRLWCTAAHPTLPLLATASSDKCVLVSSLTSFTRLSTVSGGHKRSVRSVAWKPGSGTAAVAGGASVFATGSFDASCGIWRRDGPRAVRDGDDQKEEGGEEEEDFTTRREAPGDDEDWQFSVVLDGHDSEIKSVAYSTVGPYLATCSRDKSVWIWEEMGDDEFETVAVLQEHEGDVKCVAWHPDEVLCASAGYDDSVRLWREEGEGEDWGCAAVLEGFAGTVWVVQFEGSREGDKVQGASQAWREDRKRSGPRLVTGCDDGTVQVWRRRPKERKAPPLTGQGRMPSILKTTSMEEEWVEEAKLPRAHERSVYSVDWSKRSGRIVTSGSDGRIVVYEERWRASDGDTVMSDGAEQGEHAKVLSSAAAAAAAATEWVVVAEIENAHDVFEVNHVTWAPRADKGKQQEGEEVIVSTGDDGLVKVWTVSSSV